MTPTSQPSTRSQQVIVDPSPGEALPTYLTRVATARFCTRADLGWPRFDDVHRHRDTVDLGLVAERIGIPASQLSKLSVFDHGPAVAGRTKAYIRNRMWRVAAQSRRCPSCPPGHRLAIWDLALVLTCPEHQRLLVPQDWTQDLPALDDSDHLYAHDADVGHALEQTHDPAVRARLRRAHRIARLTSYTDDANWPLPDSSYLRAVTEEAVRPPREVWTAAETPGDPVRVAVLVTTAWHAASERKATRRLVAQAWHRIDQRPSIELSPRQIKSLPPRPQSLQLPSPTSGITAPTAWARVLRIGLQPSRVPLLLHDDGTLLPPLHGIPRAHALARLALHLLDPDNALGLPRPNELRVGPSTSRDPLSKLRLTGDLDPEDLAEMLTLLECHAEDDVNYAQRRHLLADLTAVPITRLHPTPRQWPTRAEELAAGWIWADLTRGPLVRSRHPYRNNDLLDFDRRLEPEQRLALHEYGQSLLDETSQLVHATQPTLRTQSTLLERGIG